ncbi:MAG: DUF4188 domain-containing protein [Chloroflexota bacterium]
MAKQLYYGRYTAQIEGDFVVFLIGARFRMRDLFRAKWVFDSMPAMQRELYKQTDSGFLGGENFFRFLPIETILMSYWRSFDDLERFARSRDELHYPAWMRFYKEFGAEHPVGIWHETYMVRAGEYECIYGNMPKFGLAQARGVQHVNLKDVSRARERAGQEQNSLNT